MLKKRITKHVLLPSIAPVSLIGLYFTPKYVFGCANRGYMALAVVCAALLFAFAAVFKAISRKKRGETEDANWWIVTTVILVSPTLLLLGPLR